MRTCLPCVRVLLALVSMATIANALDIDLRPMPKKTTTVSTQDTLLQIEAGDDTLAVSSLKGSDTGREWIVGEEKRNSIPLISSVEIDGKTMPVHWEFQGQKSPSKSETVFRFTCKEPALELRSIWQALPGSGPVRHRIEIVNNTKKTILLPLQTTLAVSLAKKDGPTLEQWWVERGASTPSDVGTHRDSIGSNFASSLVSTPHGGPVPWTSVQDIEAKQGVYVGIEFSGFTRLTLTAKGEDVVHGQFGLGKSDKEEAEYRTRVEAGQTFVTPTVFIGCYSGDVDDGANRLRRWVEKHIRPASRANLPIMVNNSWGDGMAVDEPMARRMIDSSADLGLELYHIDAGWYRHVGDWRTDLKKFPNGLAPVSDYARSKGLQFGLWTAWSQGGDLADPSGKHAFMSVNDPTMKSWFPDDYPPTWRNSDFTGVTVCFAEPKAVDWAIRDTHRYVKEYKIDLIEHDQPQIVMQCPRTTHRHTASPIDVAYHATLGYYQVQDQLRASYPDLVFEDCCDGGHIVDYGIMQRTHYISITDTYDPLSNRRAIYDSTYAVPPSIVRMLCREPDRQNDWHVQIHAPQRNDGLVHAHGRRDALVARAASHGETRIRQLQEESPAADPTGRPVSCFRAARRKTLGRHAVLRCEDGPRPVVRIPRHDGREDLPVSPEGSRSGCPLRVGMRGQIEPNDDHDRPRVARKGRHGRACRAGEFGAGLHRSTVAPTSVRPYY